MREIKFQALVIKHKLSNLGPNMHWAGIDSYEEIIDVYDISFDKGKIDYVTDKDGDEYSFADKSLKAVRQYTGLKDKNGREIYEGDVVRNHRRYSNELLEVFWQEEVADYSSDGVYWTKEVPGFRFKRINKGMMTVFVANVDLEVIGNIYEDPELIESK
ncbi:YopX family protein [Bacillus subtilis]|uniref:YopX family protein n=1 Tax=Bacillus subtilis TaxID=1423 RepID=UPI000E2FE6A8|nr:YopX family protein [Bacillus subtilis]